jgi:hypothetical protein
MRRPSHGTIVAYVALFVALGSGAYAATHVDSRDIENNSIKSEDLKDHKAVKGRDVVDGSLTGRQVAEGKLDASRFAPMAGDVGSVCDPTSSAFIQCASVTLHLKQPSRILVIGTGGEESVGFPAEGRCEVRIDNRPTSVGAVPGEESVDNTTAGATNGFARTNVSATPEAAGTHTASLACREVLGNVKIDQPTIAALAIGTGSG